MHYSPIAIKRSNVLGDLYNQCERIQKSIPVYLNDDSSESLGQVDESMGRYADAFLFHLPEEICKGLSTGQYTYAFDFEFFVDKSPNSPIKKKRIRLNHIRLVSNLNPKFGSRKRIK